MVLVPLLLLPSCSSSEKDSSLSISAVVFLARFLVLGFSLPGIVPLELALDDRCRPVVGAAVFDGIELPDVLVAAADNDGPAEAPKSRRAATQTIRHTEGRRCFGAMACTLRHVLLLMLERI